MIDWLKSLFGKKEAVAENEQPTPAAVAAWTIDEARLAPLRRPCWIPRVEERDGPARASKFSGRAALAAGEEWPRCENCGRPLQLFLQLNSAELPATAPNPWGDALLQVFYCTSRAPQCEFDCGAYDPFASSVLLRALPLEQAVGEGTAGAEAFPAKIIVGWEETEELPGGDELPEGAFTEVEREEIGNRSGPQLGEKLGGWPFWVQWVDYPTCPRCGATMAFLFQIDSCGNLPHAFGDVGCGHVTYCKQHPEVLAFAWACY